MEDAFYARAISEGLGAPDRIETVLGAIYQTLGRIALAQGVDMADVAAKVGEPRVAPPRTYREPTREEREREEDEEVRRAFAPTLARAKAAVRRRAPDSRSRAEI
ncbi:MAG: hypothetical protein J6X44_03880 [Thermoguttaceae bacterium]|nr:hypothetical protein [Thermoguttaceae bacterium]